MDLLVRSASTWRLSTAAGVGEAADGIQKTRMPMARNGFYLGAQASRPDRPNCRSAPRKAAPASPKRNQHRGCERQRAGFGALSWRRAGLRSLALAATKEFSVAAR